MTLHACWIFFLLTWHLYSARHLYSAFQLWILSEVRLLNFLRSSHRWVAELTIWYLPTYAIWTVFRQAPAEPEQKPRNSHIVNASVYETFWDGPFINIFVDNVPNKFKWYNIHSFCQWGLGAHPSPPEKGSSDSDCATKRGNWWCWRERDRPILFCVGHRIDCKRLQLIVFFVSFVPSVFVSVF